MQGAFLCGDRGSKLSVRGLGRGLGVQQRSGGIIERLDGSGWPFPRPFADRGPRASDRSPGAALAPRTSTASADRGSGPTGTTCRPRGHFPRHGGRRPAGTALETLAECHSAQRRGRATAPIDCRLAPGNVPPVGEQRPRRPSGRHAPALRPDRSNRTPKRDTLARHETGRRWHPTCVPGRGRPSLNPAKPRTAGGRAENVSKGSQRFLAFAVCAIRLGPARPGHRSLRDSIPGIAGSKPSRTCRRLAGNERHPGSATTRASGIALHRRQQRRHGLVHIPRHQAHRSQGTPIRVAVRTGLNGLDVLIFHPLQLTPVQVILDEIHARHVVLALEGQRPNPERFRICASMSPAAGSSQPGL